MNFKLYYHDTEIGEYPSLDDCLKQIINMMENDRNISKKEFTIYRRLNSLV